MKSDTDNKISYQKELQILSNPKNIDRYNLLNNRPRLQIFKNLTCQEAKLGNLYEEIKVLALNLYKSNNNNNKENVTLKQKVNVF
jgi:hypothetical protein